jgi:hypothetical protein
MAVSGRTSRWEPFLRVFLPLEFFGLLLIREVDAMLRSLRSAFCRQATFRWFVLAVWAFLLRFEGEGVTSLVRCLGLAPSDYFNLLHFFHSSALDLRELSRCWTRKVLALTQPLRLAGRPLYVCDAIKIPKAGQKMPAVKALHQESSGNTKPGYIMGHFWCSIGVLAGSFTHCFCVPLRFVIHDGLKRSPSEKATLSDKAAALMVDTVDTRALIVADCAYACRKVLDALKKAGLLFLGSVRSNTVAYWPAPRRTGKPGRGRPRKYGEKVKLRDLFRERQRFQHADLQLYSDLKDVRYLALDLWWLGHFVRFVLTVFPNGVRKILVCTDLQLNAELIIRGYCVRFKIETAFKALVRILLAGCYRFWMLTMKRQKKGAGDQYLHRASSDYRQAIARKIGAYERFLNVAALSLGILQLVSLRCSTTVWARFASWLRTRTRHGFPSENVVRHTLRSEWARISPRSRRSTLLEEFLTGSRNPDTITDPLALAG